jgi:hypothetical protein
VPAHADSTFQLEKICGAALLFIFEVSVFVLSLLSVARVTATAGCCRKTKQKNKKKGFFFFLFTVRDGGRGAVVAGLPDLSLCILDAFFVVPLRLELARGKEKNSAFFPFFFQSVKQQL